MGVASAATAVAGDVLPDALDAPRASSPARAARRAADGQRRGAAACGGDARAARRARSAAALAVTARPHAARSSSCTRRARPPGARTPGASAPGTCARSVVVTTTWPARGHALDEARRGGPASSSLITSSSSSSGGAPRSRCERLALGEQQRQQPQALLALRAVGAQLAPVADQRQVVAVRAVPGEAALEVAVEALGQLGGELLRRRRPRPRAVAQLASRRAARGPRRCAAEPSATSAIAALAVGAQRDRVAAELEVPGAERDARDGARRARAASSALRCASAWA